MGVDAVGGAGDEGAQIQAGNELNQRRIAGQHHVHLRDLVGQRLVEDGEVKHVADLHHVQVAEQAGGGQAAVAGKHGMGAEGNIVKIFLI